MKAIMMSIRPEWVAKILNGEKTIEIRKRFLSDYVGWVYIYVTHGRQLLDLRKVDTKDNYRLTISKSNNVRWSYPPLLNGKVVARFWCDKVDYYEDVCFWSEENEKASCVTPSEFFDYMNHIKCHRSCHLIPITNLEIFNKPQDVSEFKPHYGYPTNHRLTRAPQSWRYIEIV